MNFTSIWTRPATPWRERLRRTDELFWAKLAAHLPRKLAYWSYINTGIKYIERDEVVPDVRYTEILGRLPR